MILVILRLLMASLLIYFTVVASNFAILWIDNKINLSNGKVGYHTNEPILRLAFTESQKQFRKLNRLSKKGISLLVERQNANLKRERHGAALNSILNELIYNFTDHNNLKLTSNIWYNGWYIYCPVSKQISGKQLSDVERYLAGVVAKYTQEFAIDTVTCQNLNGIGWCIIAQLNHAERAKFNQLARQQEVSQPRDFDEDDEVF